MSEPTKATIDGKTFAVLSSRAIHPEIWMLTVDDLSSWIPNRSNVVLHFPDRDRAGLAMFQSDEVLRPDGIRRVTLSVTLGKP